MLADVLLTYIDESYTASRYHIAALVCPDDEAIPLTDALNAVVQVGRSRDRNWNAQAALRNVPPTPGLDARNGGEHDLGGCGGEHGGQPPGPGQGQGKEQGRTGRTEDGRAHQLVSLSLQAEVTAGALQERLDLRLLFVHHVPERRTARFALAVHEIREVVEESFGGCDG